MFKNLRKTIVAAVVAATMIAVPLAVPAMASAATDPIQNCLSSGASLTISSGGACSGANNSTGANKVQSLVTTIVNIFSAIVGVVSVIMIIFGGFKYISSGGDSSKVTEAKNTIIYAVIGLVIVALAQFIVQFVLSKVVTS